jgi:2-polyprenyl-3-methyl-5-hydroxy-6-metoxy-1,4-benzoquinol methylase
MSPLANAYLSEAQLNLPEPRYPLHALVCGNCYLVQLQQFESPQNIFGNYFYFSSFSETWLRHACEYAATMIDRLRLRTSSKSLVVEVGSNDGYLLQYFKERGISVLGIEPAANIAEEAEKKGIPTMAKFFSTKLARELMAEGRQADLLICNNVLAHVPDLNDFVAAMKLVLKPDGKITIEFPHILRLIEGMQFDTIYHEHFSYFSFHTAERILQSHGLAVVDVQEIPTHGGSLRLMVSHPEKVKSVNPQVAGLKKREAEAGLLSMEVYESFSAKVMKSKRALVDLMTCLKKAGKSVAGYGAPAKATTLLNYCGIGTDALPYTVDRSPHKQNLFIPGVHVPIYDPDRIRQTRPDYLLVLPWNLRDEIVQQMANIREWGGRFIVPIPRAEILE